MAKDKCQGAGQGAEHVGGGTSTDSPPTAQTCGSGMSRLHVLASSSFLQGHSIARRGLCLVTGAKTLSPLFCSIPLFISPKSAERSLQGQREKSVRTHCPTVCPPDTPVEWAGEPWAPALLSQKAWDKMQAACAALRVYCQL